MDENNRNIRCKNCKFYYEALVDTYYGSGRPVRLGWESVDYPNFGGDNYYSGLVITSDGDCIGGIKGHNGYDPSFNYGSTYGQGDYIGLAIDLDNDTVSVYKNGTVFSNINGLSIAVIQM